MSSDARSGAEQRRRHYVDGRLQGRLVAGLVIFEVLLFSAAMYVLYQDLTDVVEQNMYRAHAAEHRTLPLLFAELLRIGAVLIGINVVAVVAVTYRWRARVDGILGKLERLLSSVRALDFRDVEDVETGHEVLESAVKWKRRERERCEKIRAAVASLDPNVDPAGTRTTDDTRAGLQQLRELLS